LAGEAGLDLHLDLDPTLGRRAGLEAALREAVRSGRLRPDAPMPSSRVLAAALGASRATVVAAYTQLAAEGFLISEHGSGTRVAQVHFPKASPPDEHPFGPPPRHNFLPGEPAADAFPRREWLRSLRSVVTDAPDEIFGYPDPRGRAELRRALAEHLGRTRSVVADPGAVHVVGGVASALGFIGEALSRVGTGRIAVEDPMLFLHRQILRLTGAEVVPIPVDGEGICVTDLETAAADGPVDAVLVTPSHQHPLGATMSAARRNALVEWARRNGTWIIEDDYDGEFSYSQRPVGALQGLAPDRVVYLGTASKSLAPALRLGWLVTPDGFRRHLQKVLHIRAGVSAIDQLALADLIDRGGLDRHVRAMRGIYAKRRAELGDRLATEVPWLELPRQSAGLHLTAMITDPTLDEHRVTAAAAGHGGGLLGLGVCYSDPTASRAPGVMIGFARPAEHAFAAALDALIAALHAAAGGESAIQPSA
jgi:GntR family transcriptional regulator/MocR family aminotransferase